MNKPPMPPKPAPKPGKVRVFRALFPYTPQRADELSFEEGDMLYVEDNASGDWLRASCQGKSGLVPANYVSESAESVSYPLHEAAKRGNLETLNDCLTNQVSVNGLDASGSTALYWAAHGGHLEVLERLLQVDRVCLDSQNKIGDTALHAAAWKAREDVVRRLLEAGANHGLRNSDRKTPADLASDPGVAAVLRRLSTTQPASADAEYLGSDEENSD